MVQTNLKLWARFGLAIATLIAGGTFLVAKATTARFETLELGWFRITLSFILILPAYLVFRRNRSLPARADWVRLIVIGLTGITANQLLFLHGIKFAPAIDGALLYAFTPALVLITARLWLKEAITARKSLGILLALLGVLLVLRARGLNLNAAYLKGDFYILLAVIAWVIFTLLGKPMVGRYDPLTVITWAFGIGAFSLLPFSVTVLSGMDWARPGLSGWLGLFYLSGLTSVVAFTLYYWGLKHLEAGEAAVFTNLQPALTALLAWWFLGEIPRLEVIGGGLLIILGVALTQRKARTKLPAPSGLV